MQIIDCEDSFVTALYRSVYLGSPYMTYMQLVLCSLFPARCYHDLQRNFICITSSHGGVSAVYVTSFQHHAIMHVDLFACSALAKTDGCGGRWRVRARGEGKGGGGGGVCGRNYCAPGRHAERTQPRCALGLG